MSDPLVRESVLDDFKGCKGYCRHDPPCDEVAALVAERDRYRAALTAARHRIVECLRSGVSVEDDRELLGYIDKALEGPADA